MILLTTLDEFIISKQSDFPSWYAKGELSRLLRDIGLAAKVVNRSINKAGLVDIIGYTGDTNIQGEHIKKLDIYANERFIAALKLGGECAGIASEENKQIVKIKTTGIHEPKYVVAIDPLDGSSNIEVNVSVGTIFSIFRRISKNGPCKLEDFLQKGTKQVAAGYIIYGSSTMLVYTTGKGVNGFTLDPSIGEFCLSNPNMKMPESGKIVSINHGNREGFPKGIQEYMNYCFENDKKTGRPYTSRYVGSMVADIHRNLITGGIFLYPQTKRSPDGKLRLLYEGNPMAFIIEQAGGKAIDGKKRIMNIEPKKLHQRLPVIIGSEKMVSKVEEYLKEYN